MSNEQLIKCNSNIDISCIDEMRKQLDSALQAKAAVVLDGSNIEHIDTTGLQLIISFIQELKSLNKDFRWNEPSAGLMKAARFIGVEKVLQLI